MQPEEQVRGGRKGGAVALPSPDMPAGAIFGRLRQALEMAPANEVEQSILRVRRTVYFFAYGAIYGWMANENVVLWLICASAFLVLGVALFAWLHLFPLASGLHRHFRLVFYVVVDHTVGTVGMIVYGPWAWCCTASTSLSMLEMRHAMAGFIIGSPYRCQSSAGCLSST